ncbi:MAG: IS200/IS605 family transposase [Ignavibacteriaceae bacterium]
MSWVSIWIHLVFSTKNREPYLYSKEIRKKTFKHIRENAKTKNIWIDTINGFNDHAHCLISLNKDQNISKVAQLIKGESSNWINKNKVIKHKFIWQDDYWATSVSESHLKEIRKYILEQEEHHKKITFAEEVEKFMKKYGWKYLG